MVFASPLHGCARAAYWIPIGLSADLNEAMRRTIVQGINFLVQRFGITPTEAYAYLSIGADFDLSEVVDATKEIHGLIAKRDFGAYDTRRTDWSQ